MKNFFDRSSEQEYTWKSKHINYFLKLKDIGPSTVEKIIAINPDIELWEKEYVASQLPNYEKFMTLLPEEIPTVEDFDDETVVNFKEDHFPEQLKKMKKDKPLLLWYKGNLDIKNGLGIVGSRNIIPETKDFVKNFVESLKGYDQNIVSGLANGVDEASHIAALENNLKTTAVLPSSLDNILPYSNKNLAYEIVENGGLVLTEYEPGSPRKPENSNYIARNRIQAALSEVVVVGQSSIPGGTMATAKFTLEYQKKLAVYSSSNNLDIEEYKGNKYLLSSIDSDFDFSILKFTKKQIEVLKTKKSLADFSVSENLEEIQSVLSAYLNE